MSGAVDTVDNSTESLLNYFHSLSVTDLPLGWDIQLPKEEFDEFYEMIKYKKKKRKRIRPRKKKNKSGKEGTTDIQDASTSSDTNPVSLDLSIHLSIKAISSQNHGCVFRKRRIECQFVKNFDETYIFDSREFVKLQVTNETYLHQASDQTVFRNGIFNNLNKSQTNDNTSLQSSTSQANVKKRKQKQTASCNKEVKTIIPFNDYYKIQDVEAKLKLGELIKGTIRINPKNYKTAYISNEDKNSKDYIVNSLHDRNRALEGDIVALEIKPESEWIDNQKSANVVYILEKVHPRIAVGVLTVFYDRRKRMIALQPRDKRIPRIVINDIGGSTTDESILFKAKITEWENPKYAKGTIIERIGVKGNLKNETTAILSTCQLDVSPFSSSLYKHLLESSAIPEAEFSYREDLRKECVFTIDPLTARDLDDAVSCKTLSNGNLEVGVHIADVSFYLQEETELDRMVSMKGTTIYLVENVYHMLPIELCSRCSLLPGKDSLTFSVFFEMTENGEILNHRFARTIINSCTQLAYEHVQEMLDYRYTFDQANLPAITNGYNVSDICEVVNKLMRISSNLRKKRFDNGALKIDQTKIFFKLDGTGKPVQFFKYENIEAHRLIEELMLLANITVAKKILEDFPDIAFLRRHEAPNPRLMYQTKELLESIGIHVDITNSGTLQTSLENYSTTDFLGSVRSTVLNHLLAKPMTQAKYFCASREDDYKHYALSVDTYTHFTSPIRRYADIMVHRLLAASLGYSAKPTWETDYVMAIAANCNKQKYNAKKASEASTELFLAYYIDQNQPFIQDAVVVDVKKQNFHVMVLSTGSIIRMYLNNIGEDVKHQSEEVGEKLWRISIEYEDGTRQIIEMFQIVKVRLRRKRDTFNLEGLLIHPKLAQKPNQHRHVRQTSRVS